MTTIKTTNDGSKLMSYNGTEFWTNRYGVIMQTNNWNVVDELLKAGLVTRKNHGKATYGHVSYTVK
jgi:hypothetical protein